MQELVATFQASGAPASINEPVFTLDPDALNTRTELPEEPDMSSMDAANHVFGGASARFAVLLENEAIANPEGDAYTARWAQAQQQLADVLSSDPAVRACTEIHAAGVSQGPRAAPRSCMPICRAQRGCLRRMAPQRTRRASQVSPVPRPRQEVHHQRLMNAQDRWHPHDLVDWMYLPLAAGYADHVVCETATAISYGAPRR